MDIKNINFYKHLMNKAMENKARKDSIKIMDIIGEIFHNPLKIIFDVGANVGIYSLFFSALNPDAIIYSFEPVKSNYDVLIKNISMNNTTNIRCYNFGFQTKESEIILGIPIDRESWNVGLYTCKYDGAIKDTVLCKMKNLSQWTRENSIKEIDLIKIDAEGSEYYIFSSSEDILKNTKFIHIEMNEFFNNKCNLIIDLLKKNNFYYFKTSRKSNQIWVNNLYF